MVSAQTVERKSADSADFETDEPADCVLQLRSRIVAVPSKDIAPRRFAFHCMRRKQRLPVMLQIGPVDAQPIVGISFSHSRGNGNLRSLKVTPDCF